jgi:hypothetical protein
MDPIGIDGQGEVDAIVDQEKGAVFQAEAAQLTGLFQALSIVELDPVPSGPRLGSVLHQPKTGLQALLHDWGQLGHRRSHQIELTVGQSGAAIVLVFGGSQQGDFEVVEAVPAGGGGDGQVAIDQSPEFLKHPQGFLDSGGVGGDDRRAIAAADLGWVRQARGRVTSGISGEFVTFVMELAQVLAQVLAAPDKIGSFQGKAGPFLHDPQTFSCPIQVGVDQALNRGLGCRGMGHGLERGSKKMAPVPIAATG